jgi:hypothetical protein
MTPVADTQAVVAGLDPTRGTLEVIERLATNPAVSVEVLDRLFGMQERTLARLAEQAYAGAMQRAQGAIQPIIRDKRNEQTNSGYASLEAVLAEVKPIYTREGFSLSFGEEPIVTAEMIRVGCDVMHADGHTKHYSYDCPMDDKGIAGKVNKTPTHAKGSSASYARRYLTCMIFNIPTKDDDDGNAATKKRGGKREAEPTPVPPEHLDFIDKINSAADEAELAGISRELGLKFPEGIPTAIRAAGVSKRNALRGAT